MVLQHGAINGPEEPLGVDLCLVLPPTVAVVAHDSRAGPAIRGTAQMRFG